MFKLEYICSDNRQRTDDFYGRETLQYYSGGNLSLYVVEIHRMYSTKSEPWRKPWTVSDDASV